MASKAVPDFLDALKMAQPEDWGWDAAVAATATLGVYHEAGRAELVRGLRTLLLRGGPMDAGAAAQVVARLAASPKGREAAVAEGLVPGLVGVVGNLGCGVVARAAAAAALSAIAVPGVLMMEQQGEGAGGGGGRGGGSPQKGGGGRGVDARLEVVRAGAVAPLVLLVRSGVSDGCVVEACEALYCLAGCEVGVDAVVAAGGREALQEVVLKGKRREVGERVSKAAYEALMRVL